MQKTKPGWISGIVAVLVVMLGASSASADRDKDESGHGEHRYDRDYYSDEKDDRWDDDYRERRTDRSGNNAWSVGGSWEGERGGGEIIVYGGAERYPRSSSHYRSHRDYRSSRIPPGHLPPPGECRVWLDDRPPGHQPPPTSCGRAERYAYRYGGHVVYGGPGR